MQHQHPQSPLKLALGATGIVFGDIGTSPLYAFRESFSGAHALPLDSFHVLSVLSMLIWALVLVVTVKYVYVTMRADNHGEGGSFALLALIKRVTPKSPALPFLAGAALIATALFYGDAVITPAISILSAVEGLALVNPGFAAFVIPLTLAIIAALFAVQRFGTTIIGGMFGPVMVLWFVTLAILGVLNIAANPAVLAAINPAYAVGFVLKEPMRAFFTLGTVVLAVTGAEALYADMGHFGRRAISRAWFWLVFPALLLCYCGQSAMVLTDPATIKSPLYSMVPGTLLVPLLILATAATIIASQSIISGTFSITQQAIQLGYLPRLSIRYTSRLERGHVYVPTVNLLLFVAVSGLVLGFGSSSALASAYGLAVTATMLLTTLIIGFVVFRIWRWNPLWAAPIYLLLLTLDLGLLASSSTKFADGGWLPVLIATVLVGIFTTWQIGRQRLLGQLAANAISIEDFLKSTAGIHRVPATAIYLTSHDRGIPPALVNNVKYNLVLHERILIVTVNTTLTPRVAADRRREVEELNSGITRVILRYGFAESPNVPRDLAPLLAGDAGQLTDKPAYFLSRQTLLPSARPGFARLREKLFAWMVRSSETPMTFFKLPIDRVVELGSQMSIKDS